MGRGEESCPLPRPVADDEAAAVRELLRMKRIAVVGMSADPGRAGHYVPEYLIGRGKDVVPVNPKETEILGRRCYAALADVPGGMDMVLVFRRPEYCEAVATEAAAAGARGIWLQSGIRSEAARRVAQEAGMLYVEDRCMMVELGRA